MINDKRLFYNRKIIKVLSDLVEKYPEQRFGQILFNYGFLDTDNTVLLQTGNQFIPDPFYEESEVTFRRINHVN